MASFLIWAVALACAIPLVVWTMECAAAFLPARPKRPQDPVSFRFVVLVPAHNEAGGIQATLASLSPQIGASGRILVVSDNCTDATAAIARECGAIVVERHDPEHRGKSHALAFGIRYLEEDPPDVLLIVDADCTAQPGAIAALAQMAFHTERPVQASYYLERPVQRSPQMEMAALAFFIKNVVRPTGLARLGLPCFLNGSGMAFPAAVVRSIPWANGRIAEDKWTTVELALSGRLPIFCEESRFTSRLPSNRAVLATQRTRWMHGHLESMALQGPRLLLSALARRRLDLMLLAVDLLVPPVSLMVGLWMPGMALAVGGGVFGVGWMPAVLLSACGLCASIVSNVVMRRYGYRDLGRLLAATPAYVLARLRVGATFLVRRQNQWVPTARDSGHSPDR